MIPYGRQDVTQADIDEVVSILRSDFLTQGPTVPRFEKLVSDYCGIAHGVAVNSGTAALHVACGALGLGPGDVLWTSPITFVASANCALYCGADVDFVDIDPHTYNMSADALARKLADAERDGRLPKIVMPVHLCGQSCDMRAIAELAKRYGFRIIEDASHAVGARYRDRPVGCCEYSDIAVFSFHPVKIITTAEGGMAMTNDPVLARRMQRLRSHGITREQSEMSGESHGPWYYEQIELGFNYRMTDVHAALGASQIARLDDYVTRRHELARRYDALLAELPLTTPHLDPNAYSSFHLYVIRLRRDEAARTHREVFEALRDDGIGVNLHYIPVHRQPYMRALGLAFDDLAEADAYYEEAISLPLYPTLTEADQDRVVAALGRALSG
ncbi:MAG: UDP-4-amino-4,6-dideoxy-N-acetyl-beta-L-altrosamine transaminase [Gammaproteobacteria bacterium]